MIWHCEECQTGVRGPKEPKSYDPCRICTGCSLRLGHLVFRAPKRALRRRAKKNPKLDWSWHGIHLKDELARLVEFCPEHVRARPPGLLIKHRSERPTYLGFSDPNPWAWHVELVLWPECPPAWALATLLHELAHFCCPDSGHGETFRMTFVELCRDGYGVDPAMPEGRRMVHLDYAVEDALQVWVDQNLPQQPHELPCYPHLRKPQKSKRRRRKTPPKKRTK